MLKPNDETVEAWARLLRAQRLALSTVESSLKGAGLPSLAWYDVLLELERAGKNGLRPFELQSELLLPQYSISRLIDRMGNSGYLEKLFCEDDGRGQRLIITRSGRKIRRRMWSVYSGAIEQVVGSKLGARQIETLSKLLNKLIQRRCQRKNP